MRAIKKEPGLDDASDSDEFGDGGDDDDDEDYKPVITIFTSVLCNRKFVFATSIFSYYISLVLSLILFA